MKKFIDFLKIGKKTPKKDIVPIKTNKSTTTITILNKTLLDTITIKRYNRLNGLIIKDLKKINFFVGKNGQGKSSILEMIKMLIEGRHQAHDANCIAKTKNGVEIEYNPDYRKGNGTKMDDRRKKEYDIIYIKSEDYPKGEIEINECNIEEMNKVLQYIGEEPAELVESELIEKFKKTGEVKHKEERKHIKRKNINSMAKYGEQSSGNGMYIKINIGGGLQYKSRILNKIKEELSKSTKKNQIILIDEPEHYMHPELQKDTIKEIKEIADEHQYIQTFIVTHSPFIISPLIGDENMKTYLIDNGKTKGWGNGTGDYGYYKEKVTIAISNLIGAMAKDIIPKNSTVDKINIIYCEGAEENKKDSNYYQVLFPETNNIRNIFVSCGSFNDVVNAFYIGKSSVRQVFGVNSCVIGLLDKSNSTGYQLADGTYLKTDKESEIFSKEQIDLFYKKEDKGLKIMKRREIENYLRDPERINILFPEYKEDYKHFLNEKRIDIKNGEIKDKIKNFCNKDIIEKKYLTILEENRDKIRKTNAYKELETTIFGIT